MRQLRFWRARRAEDAAFARGLALGQRLADERWRAEIAEAREACAYAETLLHYYEVALDCALYGREMYAALPPPRLH